MVVATLIAAGRLDASIVDRARAAVSASGGAPGAFRWIEEGCAGDLSFDGDQRTARLALESALDGVDVAVINPARRDCRLLVADMDSTMITVECIDELADYAGIKPQIAKVTERAMRGEIDFGQALAERVACLAGLDVAAIDRCLEERVRPTDGAKTLLATLAQSGAASVLVSGGFTRFAEPVSAQIGFDRAVANRLEVSGSVLTGRVQPPIIDAAAKRGTLLASLTRLALSQDQCVAIGDGANDVPMLQEAGIGIAYHGHAAACDAADVAIRHHDLHAVLWVLGINSERWVRRG